MPRSRVRSVVAFASGLSISSCLLAGVLSGEARAQVDTRWQAGMSAQVGVTDNVAQTPDPVEGDPDAVSPEADGLGVLSPSIALIFETAGSTHTLAYAFGATLYFTHGEANSYSNGVSYASRYVLSPTVDLALGVGAAYTQTNAFQILNGAAATVVGVQPANPAEVVSVSAAQGVEIALSDVWSLNQTLAGTALVQIGNDSVNYLLGAQVGATREFTLDTFGMSAGAEFLFQPETEAVAGNRQLILRGVGSWTRALSEEWSSSLSAGGVVARPLGQSEDEGGLPVPSNTVIQPYGRAGIDFQNDFGTAGFSVEHTVAPNVLTGSAQLTDTATLRGGLPLGQTGLLLAGTGGAGIAQVINVDGTFADDVVLVFVADVGLGYVVPALPELTLDLRYQFTRQAPADGAADPDAQIQGITRNTVLLGATMVWPPGEGAAGGAGNAAGGGSAVFRPTPAGNEDILGGVRDAREQRAQEAEDQERRERRNGGTDSDGQYDGVRGGGDSGGDDEE